MAFADFRIAATLRRDIKPVPTATARYPQEMLMWMPAYLVVHWEMTRLAL